MLSTLLTSSYQQLVSFTLVKNIHREKAPTDKTSALTKSMNMDNWVAEISNQLLFEVLKLK